MSNLQLHRKHSLLSVARRAARTGARNGAARLRGVAVLQMAVAAALTVGGFSSAIAKNRPFTLLYTFTGGNDGGYPFAGLLADNAGNLYGTAEGFGAYGDGTVFKLAPNGTETTLYTFGTGGGADAQYPQAGLIADKAGNLYGATPYGGANDDGAVFKVAPDGTETVLYAFQDETDGAQPLGGVTRDKHGNIYGPTSVATHFGSGVVFVLARNGIVTTMHSFGSGVDGLEPAAGLLADKAGNFYGTTSYGGSYGTVQSAGLGTVFKIAPDGTEKVLHSFGNGTDGAVPAASLIADKAGNLYGTTLGGGAYAASSGGYGGTVFKIAPDGTETVLYSFTGGADGSIPSSSLLLDAADNLYGTAQRGGIGGSGGNGNGVVFKLAPNGTETVLYAFTGGSDGCLPSGNLIWDNAATKGYLYGTTYYCGSGLAGTVFKVKK